MKDKIRKAIAKLKNTNIHLLLICIFYNTCFVKVVYFGCGIVLINKK